MSTRTSNVLLMLSVLLILLLSALYWERVVHSELTSVPAAPPHVLIGILTVDRDGGLEEDYQIWDAIDGHRRSSVDPLMLVFWDDSVRKLQQIELHSRDDFTIRLVDQRKSIRPR